MEEKEISVLKELLESLQPYPAMRFLLFCEKWDLPEKTLSDFCRKNGHEIQIYALSADIDPAELKELPHIRIKEYKKEQKRYNLQGRLYDYLFATGRTEDASLLPKKVYSAMANAGRIYILLGRGDEKEYAAWTENLESSNYVSISRIDLGGGHFFISAKKMHGWGG